MTTIQAPTPATTLGSPTVSYGVSREADVLQEKWGSLLSDRSVTSLFVADEALASVFKQASTRNWDGYGAAPVSLAACERAQRFLDALPGTVPVPEIGADPDGEIAFEWRLSPRQVFSVSVGAGYEVAYAGLFGAGRTHGTEFFIDELPNAVMDNLRRLYGSH
ncbi:MAG: hypothetical protein HY700_21755 [Gemmatimonadetes bacterium]|nr:hypothetical protein [Gemmatimonadota bacterium]